MKKADDKDRQLFFFSYTTQIFAKLNEWFKKA